MPVQTEVKSDEFSANVLPRQTSLVNPVGGKRKDLGLPLPTLSSSFSSASSFEPSLPTFPPGSLPPSTVSAEAKSAGVELSSTTAGSTLSGDDALPSVDSVAVTPIGAYGQSQLPPFEPSLPSFKGVADGSDGLGAERDAFSFYEELTKWIQGYDEECPVGEFSLSEILNEKDLQKRNARLQALLTYSYTYANYNVLNELFALIKSNATDGRSAYGMNNYDEECPGAELSFSEILKEKNPIERDARLKTFIAYSGVYAFTEAFGEAFNEFHRLKRDPAVSPKTSEDFIAIIIAMIKDALDKELRELEEECPAVELSLTNIFAGKETDRNENLKILISYLSANRNFGEAFAVLHKLKHNTEVKPEFYEKLLSIVTEAYFGKQNFVANVGSLVLRPRVKQVADEEGNKKMPTGQSHKVVDNRQTTAGLPPLPARGTVTQATPRNLSVFLKTARRAGGAVTSTHSVSTSPARSNVIRSANVSFRERNAFLRGVQISNSPALTGSVQQMPARFVKS